MNLRKHGIRQLPRKTVCAFANDLDNWGGGYIVIGVEEENGRPFYPLKGISVNKIDALQKDIYAKCKLNRPAYTPVVGIETYQNKQFIILWCPGGDNRPYSSPKTMAKDSPDRSVTQEGLKNYLMSNRRYRNRRIGDFLKELHLSQKGFRKLYARCI